MIRRRVLGSIGLTWGVLIVLRGLLIGVHASTAGYKAGEVAAWLFGVWLIYVSGRTIIRQLNGGTGPSPRRSHDDASM
jgi:hypothetical protein